MKKHFIQNALIFIGILVTSFSMAQSPEKEAEREARQFEKQGWASADASSTIESMLSKAWVKQLQKNALGETMWMWADASASSDVTNMSEGQAITFAKYNLIGQVQTQIETLVRANAQRLNLSIEMADAIVSAVRNSKSDLMSSLSQYKPDVRLSKKNRDNSTEILIRLFVSKESFTETSKKIMCKTVIESVKIDAKLLCQVFGVNSDCDRFLTNSRSIQLGE